MSNVLLSIIVLLVVFLVAGIAGTRYGKEYVVEGRIASVEVATTVFANVWEEYPLAVHLTDGTYYILPRGEKVKGDVMRFTIRPENVLHLWTYNRVVKVESVQ